MRSMRPPIRPLAIIGNVNVDIIVGDCPPVLHPGTESMKLTERFRRRDYGHIDLQFTVTDPKAYTKPWTVNLEFTATPDSELIEENSKQARPRSTSCVWQL